MKNLFLSVASLLVLNQAIHAQWTTSGTNIYNSNTGYVGIGTTTPAAKLHIALSNVPGINITGNNSSWVGGDISVSRTSAAGGVGQSPAIQLNDGSNTAGSWIVQGSVANGLQFFGSNSTNSWFERMRLNQYGSLGIGTTSPNAVLDVATNISGGALGTVFARQLEGASTGDGTYLGTTAWGTQQTVYNGKAFSIEYHFYGNKNSAINFYRGGGSTGGFLTFDTDNGTEKMRIDQYGDVGIGTTTPQAKLDVNGIIHATGESHFTWTGTFTDPDPGVNHDFKAGSNGIGVYGNSVFSGGYVLIGAYPATMNTSYLLNVNGNVRANKLVVNTTGADFVFEPGYKLSPLYKVEEYVKLNHRLPGMQPAAAMQKQGLDVGDNQTKLLQKIEELTLYVIEQNKKNGELSKTVEAQSTLLQQQQALLLQLQAKVEKLEKK